VTDNGVKIVRGIRYCQTQPTEPPVRAPVPRAESAIVTRLGRRASP
jgi:hypothetical protein